MFPVLPMSLFVYTADLQDTQLGFEPFATCLIDRACGPFGCLLYFDFIVSEIVFNLIICIQPIAIDKNQMAFISSI